MEPNSSSPQKTNMDIQINKKRPQNGPQSALGAIGDPRGAPERLRVPQKTSKAAPEEAQRAPLGPTGTPQEPPSDPKERPKRARGLPRGVPRGIKWCPRRSRRQKKSISTKVLRDTALPMRQALRTPLNRPQIGPEPSQIDSSDPSSGLLGQFRPLEGALATSARDSGRLGPPRVRAGVAQGRLRPPRRARSFRDAPQSGVCNSGMDYFLHNRKENFLGHNWRRV